MDMLRGPGDDGIVYEIDRKQCVTLASLRSANLRLSMALENVERRFDLATEQIILLMRAIEQQNDELDSLRERAMEGK